MSCIPRNKYVQRLRHPPKLLQGLLEGILPLYRLQLGDQDGGTNESIFERGGNTVEVIPVFDDEVNPEVFFERGRQHPIVCTASPAVECLVRQIAEARGEAKSQQCE